MSEFDKKLKTVIVTIIGKCMFFAVVSPFMPFIFSLSDIGIFAT
jgi:hypothetical protein